MRRERLPVVAGADRDDEQPVPARRPAEAVALQSWSCRQTCKAR
jgi:hypothetical protein